MNIIFGTEQATQLQGTVIELDTVFQDGLTEPITLYATLSVEDVPLSDMAVLPNLLNLHEKLMEEYRKKNWDFCTQAIEHLRGKWGGSLDSFYDNLQERVQQFSLLPPPENWDGVLHK
jgi:hypothetical protein